MAMRLGTLAKSLAITGAVTAGFYFATGPAMEDKRLLAQQALAVAKPS